MSRTLTKPQNESGPAWDVARLFPDQGTWHQGDYLDLNRRTNHLVEFSDGLVEVLEMPTKSHQRIVLFLYNALLSFSASKNSGEVLVAPYPVRLRDGKFREPDIIFMLREHVDRMGEDYADGADLVMEVVSEDRRRDLEIKPAEYAAAGIPEYWIVDPREQTIKVMHLVQNSYVADGPYRPGDRSRSHVLPGLEVDVQAVFAVAHQNM